MKYKLSYPRVEVAASGRAKCKRCKNTIPEGTNKLVCKDTIYTKEKPIDTKYSLCKLCALEEIQRLLEDLEEIVE